MDEYARAAARVHAALGALQAAPEGSRGRYTDEFTQELYNARSVRKEHGLQRMPFIAQLTELIASCKPSGAYGLVPELFARAVVDVRSAPSMPYAGDLGPNQWWRAIPSASAPPPPAPASTYHAPPPPPMPIAGPSHQYQQAYPQHYARSLSPPPPPPPPPHGRKRTASAAQLDPRPEYGGGGRDKIKFEMWTGGQRAESSSGQSAGTTGASSSRAPAKYARYNPEEPGPPKGYELCTDEQSRCDRCRERGIECWKGRKRKRASGACWNCHKLKRPCSMAKDWFAAKPFAAMSEPYETEPGSVVVLQLNEAGRLLSPRAAALAEEQAYAQRQQQQQQAYASSSHAAYHGDRPSYAYPGRSDNSHRNGRARSSTYADSTPPDTAYSSPAPHPLPLPPIPDPYASHHASRRTSVSTPYAQHPRYYPPPPAEIPPPPPPTNNVPLAIPPPPPPERITYSTHVQAPIPLDVPGDNGPRPIPPPPPPEQPHHHSAQRSATPHGSSSYTRSETSASAAASVPMVAQSASTSSQARSSSSQSHSSHEYPYASGPPPRYYDREPPPLPPPPERYREPADRYYDSPPPPRAGSGAYYERETYAAVYPPPPGYAYPPPDMYPRPGHYPPPPPPQHPNPQAHGRYNPLVDTRHDPYPYSPHDASRSRTYPPPLQPPPLADSRYAPQPYSASQLQYADTRSPYAHELRPVSRPPIRKRSESPPAIPPPPPLEWPDHPPRTAYERRRTSTRENSLKERDTVSRDRDTVAPEDDGDQVGRDDEARENGVRRDHGDTNGEASAERRDTNIDERARMLLASARSGTNGDVEMRTSSPTPVLAAAASPELDTHRVDQRGRMLLAEIRTSSPAPALLLPEDKKSREHDRDKDVRSPRPSRTPISSPPPPPGSTGTHTPGSAAAAERPACARPPTSSASTASAGGGPSTPVADVYSSTPVADVHSSPPRGGTAKRPWLI